MLRNLFLGWTWRRDGGAMGLWEREEEAHVMTSCRVSAATQGRLFHHILSSLL